MTYHLPVANLTCIIAAWEAFIPSKRSILRYRYRLTRLNVTIQTIRSESSSSSRNYDVVNRGRGVGIT
jgi:hypothetical protein